MKSEKPVKITKMRAKNLKCNRTSRQGKQEDPWGKETRTRSSTETLTSDSPRSEQPR